MFNWLFKRSSKEYQKSSRVAEFDLSNGQVQLEKTEQELIQIRDTLAEILPSMSGKIAKLQASLDEVSAKNILLQDQLDQKQIKQKTAVDAEEQEKLSEQLEVNIKELEDLRAENEILLAGMYEAQEELERQSLTQQDFQLAKSALEVRYERLIKRYSNYVDYGELKIISFDGMAAIPEIAWEMTDVFYAGIAFEKIEFKTILSEGRLGLWVKSITKPNEKPIAFKNKATLFPELVKLDVGQQMLLRQCQTSHWYAFGAVSAAIELGIKTQWRDISLVPEFDLKFWSACLQSLPKDFARIPKSFRFDRARLKQELVNPDYEHLWFELFNVSFGNIMIPKFEFRLSATQVHAKDFSRFPKLEVPLIDGKSKPFEGWYPESFDDFGDKFELRFNLNSMAVDIAVLSKLPKADREFIYGLVISLPNVLASLNNSNKNLNSPIGSWIQIANDMFRVMNTLSANNRNQQQKLKEELINPSTEIGVKSVAINEDKQASKDNETIIKNSLNQEKQNVVTTKAKGSTRKSRVRNVPSNTALDQVANSKQKNDEL